MSTPLAPLSLVLAGLMLVLGFTMSGLTMLKVGTSKVDNLSLFARQGTSGGDIGGSEDAVIAGTKFGEGTGVQYYVCENSTVPYRCSFCNSNDPSGTGGSFEGAITLDKSICECGFEIRWDLCNATDFATAFPGCEYFQSKARMFGRVAAACAIMYFCVAPLTIIGLIACRCCSEGALCCSFFFWLALLWGPQTGISMTAFILSVSLDLCPSIESAGSGFEPSRYLSLARAILGSGSMMMLFCTITWLFVAIIELKCDWRLRYQTRQAFLACFGCCSFKSNPQGTEISEIQQQRKNEPFEDLDVPEKFKIDGKGDEAEEDDDEGVAASSFCPYGMTTRESSSSFDSVAIAGEVEDDWYSLRNGQRLWVLLFDENDSYFVWKKASWANGAGSRKLWLRRSKFQVPNDKEEAKVGFHSSLPERAEYHVCFEVVGDHINLRDKPAWFRIDGEMQRIPKRERPSHLTDKVFVLLIDGTMVTTKTNKITFPLSTKAGVERPLHASSS